MNCKHLSKAINRVLALLLTIAMVATSSFVTPAFADDEEDIPAIDVSQDTEIEVENAIGEEDLLESGSEEASDFGTTDHKKSSAVFRPMGIPEEDYSTVSGTWVTAKRHNTETIPFTSMTIAAETDASGKYKEVPAEGHDGSSEEKAITVKVPKGAILYNAWTDFMGETGDDYRLGYYIALDVRPVNEDDFPAGAVTGDVVAVKNGYNKNGVSDKTLHLRQGDKDSTNDKGYCFTVIRQVAKADATLSTTLSDMIFTVDWDGEGTDFDPTWYKLDMSEVSCLGNSLIDSSQVTAVTGNEYSDNFNGSGKTVFEYYGGGTPSLASLTDNITYEAEDGTYPTTIKVASVTDNSIPYTTGFVGFNEKVPAEQEGNYIWFTFPIIGAGDATKIKLGEDKTVGADTYKTSGNPIKGLSLLKRFDPTAQNKNFAITIDTDGDGKDYVPVTYTFDCSGLVLDEPEVTQIDSVKIANLALPQIKNDDNAVAAVKEEIENKIAIALGEESRKTRGSLVWTTPAADVATGTYYLLSLKTKSANYPVVYSNVEDTAQAAILENKTTSETVLTDYYVEVQRIVKTNGDQAGTTYEKIYSNAFNITVGDNTTAGYIDAMTFDLKNTGLKLAYDATDFSTITDGPVVTLKDGTATLVYTEPEAAPTEEQLETTVYYVQYEPQAKNTNTEHYAKINPTKANVGDDLYLKATVTRWDYTKDGWKASTNANETKYVISEKTYEVVNSTNDIKVTVSGGNKEYKAGAKTTAEVITDIFGATNDNITIKGYDKNGNETPPLTEKSLVEKYGVPYYKLSYEIEKVLTKDDNGKVTKKEKYTKDIKEAVNGDELLVTVRAQLYDKNNKANEKVIGYAEPVTVTIKHKGEAVTFEAKKWVSESNYGAIASSEEYTADAIVDIKALQLTMKKTSNGQAVGSPFIYTVNKTSNGYYYDETDGVKGKVNVALYNGDKLVTDGKAVNVGKYKIVISTESEDYYSATPEEISFSITKKTIKEDYFTVTFKGASNGLKLNTSKDTADVRTFEYTGLPFCKDNAVIALADNDNVNALSANLKKELNAVLSRKEIVASTTAPAKNATTPKTDNDAYTVVLTNTGDNNFAGAITAKTGGIAKFGIAPTSPENLLVFEKEWVYKTTEEDSEGNKVTVYATTIKAQGDFFSTSKQNLDISVSDIYGNAQKVNGYTATIAPQDSTKPFLSSVDAAASGDYSSAGKFTIYYTLATKANENLNEDNKGKVDWIRVVVNTDNFNPAIVYVWLDNNYVKYPLVSTSTNTKFASSFSWVGPENYDSTGIPFTGKTLAKGDIKITQTDAQKAEVAITDDEYEYYYKAVGASNYTRISGPAAVKDAGSYMVVLNAKFRDIKVASDEGTMYRAEKEFTVAAQTAVSGKGTLAIQKPNKKAVYTGLSKDDFKGKLVFTGNVEVSMDDLELVGYGGDYTDKFTAEGTGYEQETTTVAASTGSFDRISGLGTTNFTATVPTIINLAGTVPSNDRTKLYKNNTTDKVQPFVVFKAANASNITITGTYLVVAFDTLPGADVDVTKGECAVTFKKGETIIAAKEVVKGSKIAVANIPANATISAWEIEGTGKVWNFDADVVNEDVTLVGVVASSNDSWHKDPETGIVSYYTVDAIPDQTYTGQAIKPTVTVTDNNNGGGILSNKSYTVKYYMNDGEGKPAYLGKKNPPAVTPVNVGSYVAEVTIKGIPKSTGANGNPVYMPFDIKAADMEDTTVADQMLVLSAKGEVKLAALKSVKLGKATLKYGTNYTYTAADIVKSDGQDVTASDIDKNGTITFKKAGTYKVTLNAITGKNMSGTRDVYVYVQGNSKDEQMKLLSKATVKMEKSSVDLRPVNGSDANELVRVKLSVTSSKGKESYIYDPWDAEWYVDYSVRNNKADEFTLEKVQSIEVEYAGLGKIGKVTVTVCGDGDSFFGSKSATYSIKAGKNAPKLDAKKLKNQFKKSVPYTGEGITLDDVILLANGNVAGAGNGVARLDALLGPGATYGTNYDIKYAKNVNAGTATITITAINESGWTGTIKQTFKIDKIVINNKLDRTGATPSAAIKANVSYYDATEGWYEPIDAVLYGNRLSKVIVDPDTLSTILDLGTKDLIYNTDFTVSYAKKNNVWIMTINGKGNYSGKITGIKLNAQPLSE